MAYFELKFFDCISGENNIIIERDDFFDMINIKLNGKTHSFDKSTSIKIAKTLRTEINKIK